MRTKALWRAAVVRRDGGRCRSCGYHGVHVSAHHLVFLSHCAKQYQTDVRNGLTLCNGFAGSCHERVHGGRLRIARSWLPSSVIECLAEQGLRWTEGGEPVGTLSTYFR
jgi:hypothetical protein